VRMPPPPPPEPDYVGQARVAAFGQAQEVASSVRREAAAALAAEWSLRWSPALPPTHLFEGRVRVRGWTAAWAAQRDGRAGIWLLARDVNAALPEAMLARGTGTMLDLAFGIALRQRALAGCDAAVLAELVRCAAGLDTSFSAADRNAIAEAETRLGIGDGLYRLFTDYGGGWSARWTHQALDPALALRTGEGGSEQQARAAMIVLFAWASSHPAWPIRRQRH